MTGSYSRGKEGRRYAYYHCNHCGNRARADAVNAEFLDLMNEQTVEEEAIALFNALVRGFLLEEAQTLQANAQRARDDVAALEARHNRLADALADGTMDPGLYKAKDGELKAKLAVFRAKHSEMDYRHIDLARRHLGLRPRFFVEPAFLLGKRRFSGQKGNPKPAFPRRRVPAEVEHR